MGQTILYPFSILHDNKSSYLETIKLAKKEGAKVICFTSVLEEQNLDKAYLHLLNLNGYYQTEINGWEDVDVSIERTIRLGQLERELAQYLKNEPVDVVVCQSQSGVLGSTFFSQLINDQEDQPDLIRFESHS